MGIFEQIKNAFSKGESEQIEDQLTEKVAEPPDPEPVKVDNYTVQSGDTLSTIRMIAMRSRKSLPRSPKIRPL